MMENQWLAASILFWGGIVAVIIGLCGVWLDKHFAGFITIIVGSAFAALALVVVNSWKNEQ
jgi:hypothetical protein